MRAGLTCTFALLIAAAFQGAHARVTEKCNDGSEAERLILYGDTAGQQAISTLVANPSRDPYTYDHLWSPTESALSPYAFDPWLMLTYDWVNDGEQIRREILADPVLSKYGITTVIVDRYACLATLANPVPFAVTEYHNDITDHYFMSSTPEENAFIDGGGAGPGWSRTGESFSTIQASSCYGTLPVFRFYNAENNSHFFTASATECGLLRNRDPGWQYEAKKFGAFGAYAPTNGGCPPGRTPVYRLYNNRAAQHDSNHRHVTRLDLYHHMQQLGWTGEGIAMCI